MSEVYNSLDDISAVTCLFHLNALTKFSSYLFRHKLKSTNSVLDFVTDETSHL